MKPHKLRTAKEGFGKDILGFKSNWYGRLTGPFGKELIPGSYVSKFALIGYVFFLLNNNLRNVFWLQIIYLSSVLVVTFISGERMAFATYSLGMFVLLMFLNENRRVIFFSIILGLITIFFIYKSHPFYNDFKVITYDEAFEILKNCKPNKKKKFKFLIKEWGCDLQSEHERFLVEKEFKCPVVIYNYPAKIKSFYMRLNDDGKTVRAMDILFPGIGEIVGGSQREERLEILKERIKEVGIDEKELWWYIDLRKFGTAVHSGFGLGFERLVMFATGISNIRDVIPFPRTPQNAEF